LGIPDIARRRFEKVLLDQVFEKKIGKKVPNLTRMEKLFILRCLMKRWPLELIANTIDRVRKTIDNYRIRIWEDPRRIFDVEGLYRVLGREGRRKFIECTLCLAVLRTTEGQIKRHITAHSCPPICSQTSTFSARVWASPPLKAKTLRCRCTRYWITILVARVQHGQNQTAYRNPFALHILARLIIVPMSEGLAVLTT
jgi:hypothetical protein